MVKEIYHFEYPLSKSGSKIEIKKIIVTVLSKFVVNLLIPVLNK